MGCVEPSSTVETEHIIAVPRHQGEDNHQGGSGNIASKNIHVGSGNAGGSKIIVLGSGIAGMAAAHQLAESGYDVTVLEANNYIGGRLKSIPVKLSNGSVFAFDEGASWIHGSCQKNPITILSRQIKGLKLVQTEDDSIVNYNKSGQEVQQQVDKAYEQYEKLLEKMEQIPNVSAQQAIGQLNPSKLSDKYFMFNVSNDIQFQTSGGLHQLSAQYGQSDSQFQGKEMLVTTGYQAFPEYLAKSSNVKVLLNHKVVEVENRGRGSTVKCSNGTSFQGERVVVAIPIGALKSGNIRFKPQLPSKKVEAIKNINFGNVCKILIVLKNKNIGHKEHYIGVIQDDVNKRGCATYFLNITGIAGLPAMMTFGLGINADQIESMKEADLKKLIASRIKVFAEDDISVDDFDIVRTNWRGNPNFAGAYSFSGITTLPKHWRDMAQPVFERGWYFCGEHTHSKYRGTVHGAYLSGIDAAGALLKNINEDDWSYQGQESGSESGDEGKKNQKKSSRNSRSKSKESKRSRSSKKSEKSSKKQKAKKKGSDSD